ncbi:hypothetical protein [Pseudomonas sp. microsymbiont 2]
MPDASTTLPLSYKSLVSARFATRPSLRQVLAKAGFAKLADRYPWIRVNHPELASLEAFTLLQAADEQGTVRQTVLLDELLTHFLANRDLALSPSDHLSIAPPLVFQAQAQSTGRQPVDLDMSILNSLFDDLLENLVEIFLQAQISFWNGSENATAVPRLRWMEQIIKASLLGTIERQDLDEVEKAALYTLVNGGNDTLAIHGLQVTLGQQDSAHDLILPDLLVAVQRDNRQRLLWCKPSGTVRSFASIPAFANALRDELADLYRFDAMAWASNALTDDAFSYQATQLLNAMLERIDRLQLHAIDTVDDLETLFSTLSDPGSAFPDHAEVLHQALEVPQPAWLVKASTEDRFQYHMALLELSAAQVLAKGVSSLEGIDNLRAYAARRLREQMHADHPDKTQHDPGQLLISIAQRVQISSTGPVRLEYLRTVTLVDLAISRLNDSDQEVATTIAIAGKQSDDLWIDLDYVQQLIHRVDIGGQYPIYVNRQMQDSTNSAARLARFSTEWRYGLLLSALQAKIEGQLKERPWQVLADFCRGKDDASPRLSMAQLAFRCAPRAKVNQAHCMFVIKIDSPRTWILYRPLSEDDTVKAFSSRGKLMAAISAKGKLQDNVLAWLDDSARPIYANDGFERPHLHRHLSELAHLAGPGSTLTDSLLSMLQGPASIAFRPWTSDLDKQVMQAKAKAMVLLASRQSVSNAQERWALIKQYAWLAFNTLAPLLPGPAGTLTWLVATLVTLKDDLSALTEGSTAQKVLAGTDLLINLAMLLLHASVPGETSRVLPEHLQPRFDGPQPREPATLSTTVTPAARAWKTTADPQRTGAVGLKRWHDNQRLGNLPAELLQALPPLRARIDLTGRTAVKTGRLRGLYKVGEQHYVKLQDRPYEIEETWEGVRLIGPDESRGQWTDLWGGNWDGYYIPGRERSRGPWITRWNGDWMLDLRLAGGMPRSAQAVRESNKKTFDALREQTNDIDTQLKMNDGLVERYLAKTKAYDIANTTFKKALADHPGVTRGTLPENLRQQLQDLQDLRNSHRTDLYMLSLAYEKLSTLLGSQVQLYAQLSEPRFTRFDRNNVSIYARSIWWQQWIEADLRLFHNLLDLTDYRVLKKQSQQLASLPFGQQQASVFMTFRPNVEAALGIHKRILATSKRLDENISTALNDMSLQFKDKKNRLDEIIAQRHYSIVIIHAQVISDVSQLLIKRDLLTAENYDQLLRLQADLRNRDFHEALLSHDSLMETNLPLGQQAEVLTTALREYEASLGKASYLLSLKDDEPALDGARLNEYIDALGALKSLAESELSNCLRDSDQGITPKPRPMTYRARPAKPRLIHTQRGRAILAEQEQDSNRAVQTNPMTQVAYHYEQRGEHWESVADATVAPTRGMAELANTARRLLAQKDARIILASRYANEPNSLADLMDWQIEDMADVARPLAGGTASEKALAAQLDTAVKEVQSEKRRMLVDAYFNTRHPDSRALQFLVDEKEVDITPTTDRKRLKANDFLDVYTITRKAPRQKIWEAHFHYTRAQAPAHAFAKGHLKFWEPRSMSRDEQLERSTNAKERIAIYRGDLRLEQVKDLIPFPAT